MTLAKSPDADQKWFSLALGYATTKPSRRAGGARVRRRGGRGRRVRGRGGGGRPAVRGGATRPARDRGEGDEQGAGESGPRAPRARLRAGPVKPRSRGRCSPPPAVRTEPGVSLRRIPACSAETLTNPSRIGEGRAVSTV